MCKQKQTVFTTNFYKAVFNKLYLFLFEIHCHIGSTDGLAESRNTHRKARAKSSYFYFKLKVLTSKFTANRNLLQIFSWKK